MFKKIFKIFFKILIRQQYHLQQELYCREDFLLIWIMLFEHLPVQVQFRKEKLQQSYCQYRLIYGGVSNV